jgi:hypothetical protein
MAKIQNRHALNTNRKSLVIKMSNDTTILHSIGNLSAGNVSV